MHYNTATLLQDKDSVLKVVGNDIFVPASMLLQVNPVGIGDTYIKHNVVLNDGTKFSATYLK
jgi:hypothetical protein